MKPLAITALVFASISIFIPVIGVFLALICSVLALISFRSQTTLSGITFGINILNTAFLSPSIVAADMTSSSGINSEVMSAIDSSANVASTNAGEVYAVYVGFHIVLLIIAIAWRLIRGAAKKQAQAS